jgi:hypothetical protein
MGFITSSVRHLSDVRSSAKTSKTLNVDGYSFGPADCSQAKGEFKVLTFEKKIYIALF